MNLGKALTSLLAGAGVVGLAIGLALAVAIMVGGKISGGHFNPAVTLMMVAAKKIRMNDAAPYVLAQVAGGMVALELFRKFK